MEETINTGAIYVITNLINNKKYVGKANSFVKHVRNPNYKHGTNGRFKRHLSNAKQGNNEIPLLYDEIRNYGSNNFKVDTLEICLKDNLTNREHYHILNLQTYKENIGYNFLVGDNKPEDETRKKEYELKKVESNKIRAIDGKLRQSDETLDLPPNIYKRKTGYFVQIKINSILYNKAFLSAKDKDDEKLKKAKDWLALTKQTYENIEI